MSGGVQSSSRHVGPLMMAKKEKASKKGEEKGGLPKQAPGASPRDDSDDDLVKVKVRAGVVLMGQGGYRIGKERENAKN